MNINDIFGTEQAGLVEITGFEKKRVKSSLLAVTGIAAGHIRFQAESWLPHRIPGIAGIQTGGPSQDGFISKTAGLQDFFRVQIPMRPFAEFARPQGMPEFVTGARSVGPVFATDAEIIPIQTQGLRRIKPVRHIKPPKGRRMVLTVKSSRILDRLREKGGDIP